MLGNAVVRAALADGWEVVCLQRHPSGMAEHTGVTDVLGSVLEPGDVQRAISGVDAVVHLAARVGIEGSWSDFESVNVGGTRVLLEQAMQNSVRAFVYV